MHKHIMLSVIKPITLMYWRGLVSCKNLYPIHLYLYIQQKYVHFLLCEKFRLNAVFLISGYKECLQRGVSGQYDTGQVYQRKSQVFPCG